MSLSFSAFVPMYVLVGLGGVALLILLTLVMVRHRRHAREKERLRVRRSAVEKALEGIRLGPEIAADRTARLVAVEEESAAPARPSAKVAAREPLLDSHPTRSQREAVS